MKKRKNLLKKLFFNLLFVVFFLIGVIGLKRTANEISNFIDMILFIILIFIISFTESVLYIYLKLIGLL